MSERVEPKTEIIAPRYELDDEQLETLTLSLLEEHADVSPEADVVAVEVTATEAASNIARHIERTVFEQKFGNTNKVMHKAYGPYEAASTFFVVLDRSRGKATSALRVIQNSPAGFMTLNDATRRPFGGNRAEIMNAHHMHDLNRVLDVATVATLPEHRGSVAPATRAYRAMFVWAQNHGIEHLISMIDEPVLEHMRHFFGFPFVPLGGLKPKPYLSSKSTHPVYGHVSEFIPLMTKHMDTPGGRVASRALKTLVLGANDGELIFKDRPPLSK